MVDTALTLITDALLDLGVLADEETPTASQAAGSLRKLNNMIESWNIEGLMVYGATSYTLPLVANQGVYTIGPSGNLNITRPDMIQSVFLRDLTQPVANRLDMPVYVFSDQEWQEVAFKGQQAIYPSNGVWFDMKSPLISAYVNPIPTTNQYSLVIWVNDALSSLLLTTPITLASGYKRALTASLCVELAPSYQVEVPAAIIAIANNAKTSIRRANLQINTLRLPTKLAPSQYDIRSNGWYYR